MNPADFSDPLTSLLTSVVHSEISKEPLDGLEFDAHKDTLDLTFPLVPPAGQSFETIKRIATIFGSDIHLPL